MITAAGVCASMISLDILCVCEKYEQVMRYVCAYIEQQRRVIQTGGEGGGSGIKWLSAYIGKRVMPGDL